LCATFVTSLTIKANGMTTAEQIQFAAKVQIGTKIEMGYNSTLTVKEILNLAFKGTLEVSGQKITDDCVLCYDMISNPHYNKHLRII